MGASCRRPGRLPRSPRRAVAHLRAADPAMERVIEAVGPFALPERPADLHLLCASVIGQSLSIRAAETIVGRFSAAVGERGALRPESVLACPVEQLQALGLTRGKASAIRGLAEAWMRHGWSPEAFAAMDDGEVARQLTRVKGVGPWTARMFLIFGLRRPDILPVDDLGLREALRVIHGLEARPDAADSTALAASWTPWSTVGTVYAWQYLLLQRQASLTGEHGWW
ncbi:MAG: DNA-3-methyladenine glycosylase 2 family protein [Candidatus Sumerlaeia bacterium]|nr:DNA-3-methyladenine glycosylase 2 family protein [Candidatus Sumerlaeia bacterium]